MKENNKKQDGLAIDLKSRWEKYLTKKEVLKILQECKITVQEILEIKSIQITNNKECTVKVHARILKGNFRVEKTTVILSFRLGPPTWDQFIRTTYRCGSMTGIRIIIHEGNGYERDYLNDPAGDVSCVGQLVINNNNCGLKTYLLEAKGLIQRIFEGKTHQIIYNYEYENIINNNSTEKLPSENLPSLRQVQESEFWTGFYLPGRNEFPGEPMGLTGEREEWAPMYSLYKDLKTPVIWDDDGLHINLIGDPDSELIKLIWDNKLDDFKNAYPDATIKLMEDSGKPYGISTRILDLPMKNLIKMGPNKKMECGEFINGAEHKFAHFIDNVLVELRDQGKFKELNLLS